MLIHCGYQIGYQCQAHTPMLLMVSVVPWRERDLRTSDAAITEPAVAMRNYIDAFGNRCTRLVAPPGLFRSRATSSLKTGAFRIR